MKLFEQLIKNIKGKPETSEDTKAIDKALTKDSTITIGVPISQRTFTKGEDGSYTSGEMSIGNEAPKGEKPKTVSLPSTAIQKVIYNPEEQLCYVKYRTGKTWYSFRMTPKEFKAYMAAPSKGRYTQQMRKTNYDSEWQKHEM